MNGRVLSAVFVAAVFVIVPAFALAQQVGVKAGVNFGSLTPEENEEPDSSRRLGLVAGIWISTTSTTRFSFQAEGLFSEKGVKFNNLPFDVDSSGSSTSAFATSRSRCWRAPASATRARPRASSSSAAPRRRSSYRSGQG